MQRRRLLQAALPACWIGPVPGRAFAVEPGVSDDELRFGQSAVISGPLGQQILAFNSGIQLALAEVNSSGGVVGRRVRVLTLDDELKPDKAVANYKALLNDQKVLAMFGCVGSATTAAAEGVLRESGAPMFGGYAVADSAREKSKGAAYYVRSTYGREADALVQHLVTIGITRIALAHLANPGGEEVRTLVAKSLSEHKLALAGAASVNIDASNAAAATQQLLRESPQAILMFLGAPLAAAVMEEASNSAIKPVFYGMSIVAGDAVAKKLGARARGLAIAQTMSYPWSGSDPAVLEYRRLCEAAKQPVGYYSFEGYVTARVFCEALRRAGRDITRARLHAAIRSLKLRYAGMDFDFTGGSPTGTRFVELVQVTGEGRFVR